MLTIQNIDPAIKERLRVRAAEHGHSMEAEAQAILHAALKGPGRSLSRNLDEHIQARFSPPGGVELDLPRRELTRDPPRFERCSSSIPMSCRP